MGYISSRWWCFRCVLGQSDREYSEMTALCLLTGQIIKYLIIVGFSQDIPHLELCFWLIVRVFQWFLKAVGKEHAGIAFVVVCSPPPSTIGHKSADQCIFQGCRGHWSRHGLVHRLGLVLNHSCLHAADHNSCSTMGMVQIQRTTYRCLTTTTGCDGTYRL